MTDKTTLRALALAATQGEWAVNPDDREGMEWNNEIVLAENREMRVCFMANAHSKETAAFIAAANPQTVLKLLDEVEALRKAADLGLGFVEHPSCVGIELDGIEYDRTKAKRLIKKALSSSAAHAKKDAQ